MSGSLDQIAQIVTALFVLTYLAINLVVFLEQRLRFSRRLSLLIDDLFLDEVHSVAYGLTPTQH